MAKNKMTVTVAAEYLDNAAFDYTNNGKGTISSLMINKSRKLSKDPVFNLAAWLMYNFGPCLHGETESDWIDSAKQILKIVKR
jgi:hypothetical protein